MCGTGFPAEALFVCDQCLGPLEVTYDYEAIGRAVTREQVSARPENLWRYRELLPVHEPRTGFHSGFTPLIKADRLAPPPRRPRAVHQRRLGEPPDLLVQGSRRVGGGDARDRARVRRVRLRVDRQPGQQRRGARRASWSHLLRLHPRQPRSREGDGLGHLPAARHRHQGQLRRHQPALHADCRPARLGLRQHQPAHVLRGGREDVRLRDRRAARLALPEARRLPRRRRHAAAAHRPRLRGAADAGLGRWRLCRASTPCRRPARRRSSARSRPASTSPSR